MKRCKCSSEGALRPQAGVKPLLKMAGKEALKGRQNVLASLRWQASRAGALSPLRGWDYILLFTGVLPLSVLFSGLRPLGRETSISNQFIKTMKTSILSFVIFTIGMEAMAQSGSWKDYLQAPDNTNSSPITISTPAHLAWFAEQVNNGNSFNNYTIILENSIDLSDFSGTVGT